MSSVCYSFDMIFSLIKNIIKKQFKSDDSEEDKRLLDPHEGSAGERIIRKCKNITSQVYRGEQDGTKRECAVKVIEKKMGKHQFS